MKKFICVVLYITFTFGQSEIQINTFFNNDQRDPRIVGNDDTKIILWTSYNQAANGSKEDIYMRYVDENLNKTGDEILVNDSIEGDQLYPAAAINQSGNFIVAWASFVNNESIYDIKAKLFINNIASDEFLINTTTLNSQTKPSVDINTDGSFIIVWESWFEDGSDKGIYGQRFNPDGTKNGAQFLINTTTMYSQARPVVKYFPDGKFIVVWESWKQDEPSAPGYGVYGRIYNSSGAPITGEIGINTYTSDYQWFADVITLDDQNYAVAWCSWEQDGSDGGIYIKKLNAYWEYYGNEVLVNASTRYYQWLPKLAETPGGNIAIVWSSWEQDGSREGIYAKILDSQLNDRSFEVRLNNVTENFQWEPSLLALNDDELLVVWSGYDEIQKAYNIIAKRENFILREGVISSDSYDHVAGISTTSFLVNVVDSTQLTGNQYEISFAKNSMDEFYASIKNINNNTIVVPALDLNKGENIYYISQVFEGVAVQIKPVLMLSVDYNKSFFKNNSGSNIQFNIINPTGTTVIAPIDLIIQWGEATKNPDGTYAFPLDSAYSTSGKTDIKVPYRVWDVTNNRRMDSYIVEPVLTRNKRWDPGENIIILTPPEYQQTFPNFHVQVNTSAPQGTFAYPAPGDTIFIFTRRPVTINDVFTFSTSRQFITQTTNENTSPDDFLLFQNYPNPFNPSTKISFTLPEDGAIKLKIYNVLGELALVIYEGFMEQGTHRFLFNADVKGLSSGIYFYSLEAGKKIITKKMVFLK